jgi:cell division protein FtsQ
MNIKRIVVYALAILVLIGCFVGYAVLTKDQRYKKVVFEIVYPSDTLFTKDDLKNYADKHSPVIAGQFVDSVKLLDFEQKLKKYPYLETVDIVTNQGIVTVKAKQEKVIAKVFTVENKLFYLAKSGKILPDSLFSAGRVVVANGNISIRYKPFSFADTEEKNSSLKKIKGNYSSLYTIWKIADYLDENAFWKAQIGQIYIDGNGDVQLTPTVGEHLVIFGKIRYCDNPSEEVEQRFDKLKNVYKQGFKITGWERYKTINLKFGNGIPCEKRIE